MCLGKRRLVEMRSVSERILNPKDSSLSLVRDTGTHAIEKTRPAVGLV